PVAITPDFFTDLFDLGIAGRVILQAGRFDRLGTNDDRSVIHELANLARDRHGHALGFRQHQHAVAHAVGHDEFPAVLNGHARQELSFATRVTRVPSRAALGPALN